MTRVLRLALCALPAVAGAAVSAAWFLRPSAPANASAAPGFQPGVVDLGLGRPGEVRPFEAAFVNASDRPDVFALESPSCNLSGLHPTLVQLAAGESCLVRGQVRVLGAGDCSAQVFARSQNGGSQAELPIGLSGRDEPHLPVTAIPLGIAPGGGRTFEVRVPVYVGEGAWAADSVRGRVAGDLEGNLELVDDHLPPGYVLVAGTARATRDDLHGVLDGRIHVQVDGPAPMELEGYLLCEVTPPGAPVGWSSCRVMLRDQAVVLDLAATSIQSVARERSDGADASWVELALLRIGGSSLEFRRRDVGSDNEPGAPEDFLVTTERGVVRVRVLDAVRKPLSGL